MRIGIDYTPAVRQAAGIGRLTRQLVGHLLRLDRRNSYHLFVAGPLKGSDLPWSGEPPANARIHATRIPERALTILWHRLRLNWPVERFTGPCDLFHSTDFVLPPVARARALLTVHDLSFLRHPECAHPRLRAYLSSVVPRSLKRAHHVLADSEATKRDLIDLLGVERDKITVLYAGIEERFSPQADPAAEAQMRRALQLEGPYILSLGTIEPRKNYARLARAYRELLALHGNDAPPLVIAGGKGWLYEGVFRSVEELKLGDRVRFLGFVEDQHLPALYRGATLFVFPSLYEGFGFPPLEAMACGCPVVCSNRPSLPEVVGDAARLVDPCDESHICQGMRIALFDSQERERLVERGLARAARFSWPAAAERLLAIYEGMGSA